MERILNKEELKKLKELELMILSEFDRVCRKYHIHYSLAYGTLIGAIRHKGFIPWDDDVDVMLTRSEYERLNSIIDNELREEFVYVDSNRNDNYGLSFGKLMLKDTIMREVQLENTRIPCGVFVDVFVIDSISNIELERIESWKRANYIHDILTCRSGYKYNLKGIYALAYRIRGYIYKLTKNKQGLNDSFQRNARRYENDKTCLMGVDFGGCCGTKPLYFPLHSFDNYIDIAFEGLKCECISDYDTVLRATYGNYLELPPKEERIPHHTVSEVDFGKYR